jgi:phage tail tube protein FII
MGLPQTEEHQRLWRQHQLSGRDRRIEEPKLSIATDDWRGADARPDQDRQGPRSDGGHPHHGRPHRRADPHLRHDRRGRRALRLVGAYQADDGSPPQSVEIYLGGRFTEIDLGKSKAGDDTEHKYTLPLSYYRRVVDGVDEVEIDMLAGLFRVGGIDR